MAKPFASRDEADAALSAFFEGIRKLRRKHRVREVSVETMVTFVEGEKHPAIISSIFNGDATLHVPMLINALGRAQRDHNARVAESVVRAIGGEP